MRCTYSNDDLEIEVDDVLYVVDVHAVADYTCSPGRMYMPNGDPGYPPESDFELEEVDATWYDEDNNEIEPTESMTDALRDFLNDSIDLFEE